MRKRQVLLYFVLVVMLAFAASGGVALGKGHVPVGKIQVTHRGIVKEIPEQARSGHVGHEDIHLPACDFNNIFMTGDDAPAGLVADSLGFLDTDASGLDDRDPANGITPACGAGTF